MPIHASRLAAYLPAALLLALGGCMPYPNVARPAHAEGYIQVGWVEHADADKNVEITVKAAPGTPYSVMLEAAEKRARAECPQGYRVKDVHGADEPQEDVLSPNIVIDSEVQFKFHCVENDTQ